MFSNTAQNIIYFSWSVCRSQNEKYFWGNNETSHHIEQRWWNEDENWPVSKDFVYTSFIPGGGGGGGRL